MTVDFIPELAPDSWAAAGSFFKTCAEAGWAKTTSDNATSAAENLVVMKKISEFS